MGNDTMKVNAAQPSAIPSVETKPSRELDAAPPFIPRQETLEESSDRERNEALARRDVAYISSELDDFWGFGG